MALHLSTRTVPGRICKARDSRLGSSKQVYLESSQAGHTRSRWLARSQSASASNYKSEAAKLLVKTFVKNGQVIGFGAGELVNLAIKEIGSQLASGSLQGVVGVPVSDAAAHEAAFHGVPLTTFNQVDKVDVLVEGADQVHPKANACIKGVEAEPQQPQLLRFKQGVSKASQLVVLVEQSQVVEELTGPIPVLIDGEDWEETAEELDDLFLGDGEIWRRPTTGTSNPRGGDDPYTSPEGHHLLDVRLDDGFKLYGEKAEYATIVEEIESIPGVLAHGLVLNAMSALVVARPDTSPEIITPLTPAAARGVTASE